MMITKETVLFPGPDSHKCQEQVTVYKVLGDKNQEGSLEINLFIISINCRQDLRTIKGW